MVLELRTHSCRMQLLNSDYRRVSICGIIPAMVAIVGRPNTGKSTLFNRLVGGRVSITLQEPGITRDRVIREAEWLGRRFRVVDTGGLIPNSKVEMNREVERQVQIALDEARVIVVVVDGSLGLQPLDEEIAARLRRAGREFVVAVNKLDIKRKFEEAEYHRLGGAALVRISAELGTGVDDLLDAVLTRLPENERAKRADVLSLTIIGRPNVGKSSLMNYLLGHSRAIVTAAPGTTRDVIEESFELEGKTYRLLDTAGIRRKPRVSEPVEYYSVTRAIEQIRHCDVALVMFDAFDGPNNQDKRIVNLVEERSRGLVVIANKMDTVPDKLKEKVRDWVKKELSFVNYAPVMYTSVLQGLGVTAAVHEARRVWENGGRQVPGTKLREQILPLLEQNQPRFDCRVVALTQVGTRPPTFRLRVTRPKVLTPAYERFVIAEIRKRYKFVGYPIRIRVTR
ncbi:ribosome biogenesis GTPase Der [candidate division WOR-3 bacterium]|uniref:GTPase Der n=1 Tax=candidate division WOR-3 bacterium TaxID=2052148 RepID=A0A938BP20_UNCW3|nr:ribosome biogenesis GTPase Der [candidate division WOR-3 bacterium]